MKVVVGLGNPGRQYAETRHNIGWMVLDRLGERARWSDRPARGSAAAIVSGRYRGLDLALVKPHTFMNLSGRAVRKALVRFRAPLEELLVVVDDFALPFGRLRFREAGSSGGHNGLDSIIGELGSHRFARLRVGIGEPGGDAVDHVLSRFAADERRALDEVIDAAADAVEDWARLGTAKAASRWNSRWLGEGSEAPVAGSEGAGAPTGTGGAEAPPARQRERSESSGRWRRGASPRASEGDAASVGAGGDAAPPTVGPDGIRRTRSGWRKLLGWPKDGDR